jgi:hypothetical protein
VLTKDQAQGCAEGLLAAARAESEAKALRRLFWLGASGPELNAWPASRRLAVWREALTATRWEWPVRLGLAAYLIPCIALAVILMMPSLRTAKLPIAYLSWLPAVGLLLIQRVHRSCARRYLRSIAPSQVS